jgi:hypothetical protein
MAVFVLVERGVDRAGLGDELVELEGQQGVTLAGVLQALIGQADPLQQSFKVLAADFRGLLGSGREICDNFRYPPRFAAKQYAIAAIESDLIFQPDGDRVGLEQSKVRIKVDPGGDGSAEF